ncbi:MAG: hypothetical protein QOF48_691 [Verrucomicrobiota bacterium]|jgi:hypothetical protein
MPIRINLLAETQAAEELRRKDPVKRAIYVAVMGVFLIALWASTLQFQIMTAKGNLSSLDTKWKGIEKGYKEAVDSQRATIETEQKLAALDLMTSNRFLWGTALNAFQHTLNGVDDIQVSHLRTEQVYILNEETKPPPNSPPGVQGKPATATERIKMTVDAADATASPAGGRVNKYKESIVSVPYFKESLTKTNGVLLTQRSAPQLSKFGAGTVVNFTLECFFPEKTR